MKLPPLNIHALLNEFDMKADKSLGQNFLHDSSALQQIIDAAEIQKSDIVLEIGPGFGSLTRYLALLAGKVICVELDHDFIPILGRVLTPYSNIEIIEGDILKIRISNLVHDENYLVVANVPYNITSAIFRHLLDNFPRPKRLVLTIQKEVAQRICAEPGNMSLLALSVQIYGKPRIANIISAECFYPVPKVESAIIRVDMNPEPLISQELLEPFFLLAKAGFSQKRKTLRNSISAGLRITKEDAAFLLENSGIDPMRRAETLSIPEWSVLTKQFKKDKKQLFEV